MVEDLRDSQGLRIKVVLVLGSVMTQKPRILQNWNFNDLFVYFDHFPFNIIFIENFGRVGRKFLVKQKIESHNGEGRIWVFSLCTTYFWAYTGGEGIV